MKTVDVLIKARELITKESTYHNGVQTPGRTRWFIYRKSNGDPTMKLSEATCFCSLGAINAAVGADAENNGLGLYSEEALITWGFYGRTGTKPPTKTQRAAFSNASRYLLAAIKRLGYVNNVGEISFFNDSMRGQAGHLMVLKAFDLAIKNAKRRHINGGRLAA
jgi:hypothetical protein